MSKKVLNILIEGKDDEVFFKTFIEERSCFQNSKNSDYKYDIFVYHKCRTMSDKQVRDIIKTIVEKNEDYEVFVDLDTHGQDERKKEFKKRYGVSTDKIHLVIKLMEGWLLAGFDETFCNRYKLKFIQNTEQTTKKEFERIAKLAYGKKGTPKQLRKLLTITKKADFSFQEGIKRNNSLAKFYNYFGLNC